MSEMSTRQHTKRSAVEPTTATTIDRQTTGEGGKEGGKENRRAGNW